MERSRSKPEYQINIARERIEILFGEAENILKEKPIEGDMKINVGVANRYAELAKKIGMRYNVRLTKQQKRRVCKNCYAYLKPGLTCRWSPKKGIINVKCFGCEKIMRYPYK